MEEFRDGIKLVRNLYTRSLKFGIEEGCSSWGVRKRSKSK